MRWIDPELVCRIHFEAIEMFGGSFGLRDRELLESALMRPRQHFEWTEDELITVAHLAALYIVALTQNHPFVDGNKRTGFAVGCVFAELNGWTPNFDEREIEPTMSALAAGEMEVSNFIAFICGRIREDI